MIIYTAIIGYNGEMAANAIDLTTLKANPTPVEALLRPTQALYDGYKRYSLQHELLKKTISEKQRKDMLYLISQLPENIEALSLEQFIIDYTALVRSRVSVDLPLFKSIFDAPSVKLACTCKPGIHHFCHKYVVMEIIDTSARKFGLKVEYGGELDELGRQYRPDRNIVDKPRKKYVPEESTSYEPKYVADYPRDEVEPDMA